MSGGGREHSKRTPMDFYISQCCDKVAHDKPSAVEEARRMTRVYHQYFRAYYCTFCYKWHVGKFKRTIPKKRINHKADRSLYRSRS